MMAVVSNRRSVMTLFSRPTDIHSHRARLVLAEKNINIEISNIPGPELPEDLMDLNPYHSVPTLVDRDLTLYDSRVIIEYLDERFPHPPLMPVDPVTRAQFRLALDQAVCIVDWRRHQYAGFIGGVAKHQALVARALFFVVGFVNANSNVRALLANRIEYSAGGAVETHFRAVVANIENNVANDVFKIDVSACANFACYHNHARFY